MLEIKLDQSEALQTLIRINKSVNPPGPLLDKIGMDLAESTMQRFPRGISPAGIKWKAKSPFTLQLNPRAGNRPLIGETKNLSTSIAHQVSGNSVRVGSPVKYAAIHQFGGTIKPVKAKALRLGGPNSKVWRKIVTIPARPFLGISDADRVEMQETIRDWIVRESH